MYKDRISENSTFYISTQRVLLILKVEFFQKKTQEMIFELNVRKVNSKSLFYASITDI